MLNYQRVDGAWNIFKSLVFAARLADLSISREAASTCPMVLPPLQFASNHREKPMVSSLYRIMFESSFLVVNPIYVSFVHGENLLWYIESSFLVKPTHVIHTAITDGGPPPLQVGL